MIRRFSIVDRYLADLKVSGFVVSSAISAMRTKLTEPDQLIMTPLHPMPGLNT